MCNLYSVTQPQSVICELSKTLLDTSGYLPRLSGILPKNVAPVVINRPDTGQRELLLMRWGVPSPFSANRPPVTNVHDTKGHFWRPHLRPSLRCLVPVTSFCDDDYRSGKAVPTWFAMDDTRPLFFFAGIWRSLRTIEPPRRGANLTKASLASGDQLLFSFLVTEPNAEIAAHELRTMPVLLLTENDRETWMNAPIDQALASRDRLEIGH